MGFSASVRQGDALDGSLVAVTDAANRQHKLYQNALYDFVEEAIAEGVGHLGLGRTALEIKSGRAEPHPVAIYLRSPHGLLHRLLAYAGAAGAARWTPRHPSPGATGPPSVRTDAEASRQPAPRACSHRRARPRCGPRWGWRGLEGPLTEHGPAVTGTSQVVGWRATQ